MTCDMRGCASPAAVFTWEEQFCDKCWVEVGTPVEHCKSAMPGLAHLPVRERVRCDQDKDHQTEHEGPIPLVPTASDPLGVQRAQQGEHRQKWPNRRLR